MPGDLLMHRVEIDRLRGRLVMACETTIALASHALSLPSLGSVTPDEVTTKLFHADDRLQYLLYVFRAARDAIHYSN
jgi:hypothetical protein